MRDIQAHRTLPKWTLQPIEYRAHDFLQWVPLPVDLHRSRLELCHIEYVVDDVRHAIRLVVNRLNHLSLRAGGQLALTFQQTACTASHYRQRASEVMRDRV